MGQVSVNRCTLQRQKAVSAYFTSEQILLFGFAEQLLWYLSHVLTLTITICLIDIWALIDSAGWGMG